LKTHRNRVGVGCDVRGKSIGKNPKPGLIGPDLGWFNSV
jgi:hypothetical protein